MSASGRVGPTGSRPIFRNSPTVLEACKNCRAKKVRVCDDAAYSVVTGLFDPAAG
jgi:hypothetical protein